MLQTTTKNWGWQKLFFYLRQRFTEHQREYEIEHHEVETYIISKKLFNKCFISNFFLP